MKSLIAILIALTSLSSQAAFIKSDYLYGVSKRYAKMVDNTGEAFLHKTHRKHGKWVDEKEIIEYYTHHMGHQGSNVIKIGDKNRWHKLVQLLMTDEPYFCETMDADFWSISNPNSLKNCRKNLRKLLGDAVDKADAIHALEIWGDYYGDWHQVIVILSDYKTKETITLNFDIIHEI